MTLGQTITKRLQNFADNLEGKVKIGCCAIVRDPTKQKILCIECSKGRGLILPGGKFEPDKDSLFTDTAKRELFEETGIRAKTARYVFGGLDCSGYYCYAFLMEDIYYSGLKEETKEGKVVWTYGPKSRLFDPYYQLVAQELDRKFYFRPW